MTNGLQLPTLPTVAALPPPPTELIQTINTVASQLISLPASVLSSLTAGITGVFTSLQSATSQILTAPLTARAPAGGGGGEQVPPQPAQQPTQPADYFIGR